MKIKLTGTKFNENQGKIVTPNYIDDVGDANISGVSLGVDYDWAFNEEYVIVHEVETDTKEEQQFTVTLKVKDLLELHDLLQTLPRSLVETATLTIN